MTFDRDDARRERPAGPHHSHLHGRGHRGARVGPGRHRGGPPGLRAAGRRHREGWASRSPPAGAGLDPRAGPKPGGRRFPAYPAAAGRRGSCLVAGRRPAAGPAPSARAAVRPGRRYWWGRRIGTCRARRGAASAAAACPSRDGGRAPCRGRAGRGQGQPPRAAPTRTPQPRTPRNSRTRMAGNLKLLAGLVAGYVLGARGWPRTLRADCRGRPGSWRGPRRDRVATVPGRRGGSERPGR